MAVAAGVAHGALLVCVRAHAPARRDAGRPARQARGARRPGIQPALCVRAAAHLHRRLHRRAAAARRATRKRRLKPIFHVISKTYYDSAYAALAVRTTNGDPRNVAASRLSLPRHSERAYSGESCDRRIADRRPRDVP
ncbi:hypothetical protein PUN4_190036 [Paraburkholderia unamae]|nr:hypothetical protein PUN4_190036 [Paraburkholderia unamae]